MITDVFNRLVSFVDNYYVVSFNGFSPLYFFSCLVRSCHTKCVSPRYAEPDLSKGESVCIDRCVAKFFEVNKKVCRRRVLCLSYVSNKWVGRLARNYKMLGMQQAEGAHSQCSRNSGLLTMPCGQVLHIHIRRLS
jgi:hypothetical protein